MRRALAFAFLLLAAGCAVEILEQVASDTLTFGTARADGTIVSDGEWQQFLNDVVTARFPDGVTSWDGERASRGGKRERMHIVQIVHSRNGAAIGHVAAIMTEYRRRFGGASASQVRSDVWLPLR
jgi:hypothetical protein